MHAIKYVAVSLIIAGCLALVYGKFTYTKETNQLKFGSIELTVKSEETVNIPVWAGIAAIVAGTGLLLIRK